MPALPGRGVAFRVRLARWSHDECALRAALRDAGGARAARAKVKTWQAKRWQPYFDPRFCLIHPSVTRVRCRHVSSCNLWAVQLAVILAPPDSLAPTTSYRLASMKPSHCGGAEGVQQTFLNGEYISCKDLKAHFAYHRLQSGRVKVDIYGRRVAVFLAVYGRAPLSLITKTYRDASSPR
jgi:hypothetical protein